MEIYELKNIDYYINEKEAFDKSVFNPAEYTVTLAVKAGTNLDNFIKKGQQVSGTYTVNGLTTNFESLVQELAISRDFQAGYDMYNLTLSENVLNVDRASILDVQDGGTGRGELHGILKGNGLQPIETADAGIDYIEPLIEDVPFTPISASSVVTITNPLDFSFAIMSNVLYLRINDIKINYPSGTSLQTIGSISFPTGVKVPFQCEGVALYRVSGFEHVRVLIQENGDVLVARGSSTAQNASIGCLLPYPLVKS